MEKPTYCYRVAGPNDDNTKTQTWLNDQAKAGRQLISVIGLATGATLFVTSAQPHTLIQIGRA